MAYNDMAALLQDSDWGRDVRAEEFIMAAVRERKVDSFLSDIMFDLHHIKTWYEKGVKEFLWGIDKNGNGTRISSLKDIRENKDVRKAMIEHSSECYIIRVTGTIYDGVRAPRFHLCRVERYSEEGE